MGSGRQKTTTGAGTRSSRRWGQGFSTVALIVAAALAIAACGSSSDSSSTSRHTASSQATASNAANTSGDPAAAGVARAEAVVAAARGPITSIPAPGPSLETTALRGKSIWYIPLGAQIPALDAEALAIQAAAKALGMNYNTCDGKLTPAVWAACINQAVNAGAAGIMIDSINPATVGTALANAKSHKIPVVAGNETVPSSPLFQSMDIGGDLHDQPIAMDWIIVHSSGKAHILISQVVGDPASTAEVNGSLAEMHRNCPLCVAHIVTSTPETVPNLQSSTSTALLQHPDVDYGYPEYDFLEPLFAKGVQQAGHKLQIVSTDDTYSDLMEIKDGTGQVADSGANRNYLGWAAVDRLIRMILHKPAPTDVTVPIRLFDASNINTITLTPSGANSGVWWGSTSYQQQFQKLWGVG
jgi:ribose transport system substrate-binding protein